MKRMHVTLVMMTAAIVFVFAQTVPAQDSPVEITGEYKIQAVWTDYSVSITGSREVTEQNLVLNAYLALSPSADLFVRLNTDWKYGLRTPFDLAHGGFTNSVFTTTRDDPGKYLNLAYIFVTDALSSGIDLTLGRQFINVGHNLVLADEVDGVSFTRYFYEQVKVSFFAFDKHEQFDTSMTGALATSKISQSDVPNNMLSLLKTAPKDWKLVSKPGFNVLGLTFSVDIGDHAVTGYFIQDSWTLFDPFTRLGNYTVPGGGAAADTSYTGFTLDGYYNPQLKYLFEFCHFDPDLPDVGSANLTFYGLDWYVTEDLSLLTVFGEGEERFFPAQIGHDHSFSGLGGRRTAAGMPQYRGWNHLLGTGSLAGVRDYLTRLSYALDEITSTYLQYELASDYETSGSGIIGAQQDYRLYTVGISRDFRENIAGTLEYRNLRYESGVLNDLPNGGGWDQIRAELIYSF